MSGPIELDYCQKCDYLFPDRTQVCPACNGKTVTGKYEKRLIIEKLAFIFASAFIGFVVSLIIGDSFGAALIAAITVPIIIYSTYYTAKSLFGMNEHFTELVKVGDINKFEQTVFSPSRFALEFLHFPWLIVKLMLRIVFFWI